MKILTNTPCATCGTSEQYTSNGELKGCVVCAIAGERRRYIANPELKHSRNSVWVRKWKDKAFQILGGVCVRCGFSDIRALQIDHVNGGGSKDRLRRSVGTFYRSVAEDQSGKFQLLCANCNWIKRLTEDNDNGSI